MATTETTQRTGDEMCPCGRAHTRAEHGYNPDSLLTGAYIEALDAAAPSGHEDDDDCTKYLPEHLVTLNGGKQAFVGDLQVDDVFRDDQVEGWWRVDDIERVDEDIHVTLVGVDGNGMERE